MTLRTALAAGCLLALGGAACGDDSGGSGGAGGSGSAQQGSPTGQGGTEVVGCGPVTDHFTAAECSDCAEAACCDELLACHDNYQCENVVFCLDGCGDAAGCVESCEGKYGSDEALAVRDALDACVSGA